MVHGLRYKVYGKIKKICRGRPAPGTPLPWRRRLPAREDARLHILTDSNLINMGRIICIANHKGGVGKTTTAINLGTALALAEKKTLLVDIDPQGHLATGMGIDKAVIKTHTDDVLQKENDLSGLIMDYEIDCLKIIPSLMGLDSGTLKRGPMRGGLLNDLLKQQKDNFDYILIDCPPSIGFLTISAMTASDSILIPLQCEYFAVESLEQLLKMIKQIKNKNSPDLVIEGILLTMVDTNEEFSLKIADETRKRFNELFFKTMIPRSGNLIESAFYRRPVFLWNITCEASRCYLNLAGEIIEKN